jgi:hypothetical protein
MPGIETREGHTGYDVPYGMRITENLTRLIIKGSPPTKEQQNEMYAIALLEDMGAIYHPKQAQTLRENRRRAENNRNAKKRAKRRVA